MFIRGQLAYRPATEDRRLVAMAGIIEAPAGAFEPESVHTFSGRGGLDAFRGIMLEDIKTLKGRDAAEAHISDLSGTIMMQIWNKSEGTSDVFQLFIREATAEADDPSKKLYIASGVAQVLDPNLIPSQGFSELTMERPGFPFKLDFARTKDSNLSRQWRGSSHGAILSQPIWGWGEEGWAVRSTLKPAFLKDCEELRQLVAKDLLLEETLTPEEAKRKAELDQTEARYVGGDVTLKRDPNYLKFLKMNVLENGIDCLRFSGKETASEIRTREDSLKILVRSLLESESPGF